MMDSTCTHKLSGFMLSWRVGTFQKFQTLTEGQQMEWIPKERWRETKNGTLPQVCCQHIDHPFCWPVFLMGDFFKVKRCFDGSDLRAQTLLQFQILAPITKQFALPQASYVTSLYLRLHVHNSNSSISQGSYYGWHAAWLRYDDCKWEKCWYRIGPNRYYFVILHGNWSTSKQALKILYAQGSLWKKQSLDKLELTSGFQSWNSQRGGQSHFTNFRVENHPPSQKKCLRYQLDP